MSRRKKYSLNDEYFSELNEENCYWLGVMYADGNVSTNTANTTGTIKFSSTDREWVEQFKTAVNYNGPVREEIHKKFKKSIWKITISSRKMYEDLVNLGCIPRKSLVIEFPKVPFPHHFIRGYFDGDGSITVCRNIKSSEWKIMKASICSGSKIFLEQLLTHIPIKSKKCYTGKHIFEIKMSLNDSIHFLNFIYSGNGPCLLRKYSKFKEYIDNFQPRKCSTTTIGQLKELKV